MAIYRILQNSPLSPEDISRLTTAYETTLKALDLTDRSDPITELVARKIIEIGQTGVRDPVEISRRAVAFGFDSACAVLLDSFQKPVGPIGCRPTGLQGNVRRFRPGPLPPMQGRVPRARPPASEWLFAPMPDLRGPAVL
jgi:hypothetical protein